MSNGTRWFIYAFLVVIALCFSVFIAIHLANDEPDDGRVYAQIARNVLEQHVYSHDAQPPYTPSIIRLPGYPLFLVGVYAVFGHCNNTAVRVVQAALDTITCALIAWVVFEWTRKQLAALLAFALAAVCPFTAIYVATILTEAPTNFLAVAMVLTATFAFKATARKQAVVWWGATGLIAGIAVLFRPDSGLFAAAIGLTLVLSSLRRFREATLDAAIFSLAFCLVLVPWTIRNRRVFHIFQPLAPAHAEMPGEFVPRGYLLWVRTWLDDARYVGPALWALDMRQIHVDDFPARAFDSREERDRVAALFEKYNHPDGDEVDSSDPEADEPEEEPEPDEHPQPEDADVEMTPEIDAGFAQLGQERVAHSRFRYYVVLPLKRSVTLWFDTHSQYYPFNGELLPLEDLDHDIHQQYWLPLFAGLTWIYTLLGVLGGWLLWRWGERRSVLMIALLIFLRLGFFASLENPEPRYTVELFPLLIIVGSAGLATILDRINKIAQD